MGVVFSLYKRKPKERYELGKHRHGWAPGFEPPKETLEEKMAALATAMQTMMGPPSTKQLSDHYSAMTALINPASGMMWSIMGTPDYSVFKLSRFSCEELAVIFYQASQNVDSLDQARKIAADMLSWAGDDDITLNPEEPGDLADLGWPTRGYKDVGGIWRAMPE